MKLVDILARELKVWPEGMSETVGQGHKGYLHGYAGNGHPSCQMTKDIFTLCDDYEAEKVTRPQWQAAVDALRPEKKQREAINWTASPEWAKELAINSHGEAAWLGDNGYEYFRGGSFHEWSTPSSFPPDCFKVVESRPAVWGGEGLPSAGVECEADGSPNPDGWGRCRILYSSADVIVFKRDEFNFESFSPAGHHSFRPIRTPEQIDKQERSKACDKMFGVILDKIPQERRNNGSDICEALYDAGYRKFEIVEGEQCRPK